MKIDILGAKINSTTMEEVIGEIKSWITYKEYWGRYICVSNVHVIMEGFDDNKFMQIINNADIAVPDGRPLVWAQRFMGEKQSQQVRGSDLFMTLCNLSSQYGYGIGFYGGTENVLTKLIIKIKNIFPQINISFTHSPPFRSSTLSEDKKIIEKINSSNIKILFVGIGCPKQEIWMQKHSNSIKCIMIGVGAAFDFISGEKKESPKWLQYIGLEWFFRFLSEPRRLFLRYFKHNPRFIWYLLKNLK